MEKYGTIPKRFTKAWWEYFWEYYKWHTIAVVFVVFMITSIIYSNVTATKYDMYVSYVGTGFFEEAKPKLTEVLAPVTEEITDNEKIDISYDTYSMDASAVPDAAMAEMESAIGMKLMAELEAGDSYLYLVTKGNLDSFYALTDCFTDTALYAGDSENVFTDENGRACAIALKDNEKLTGAGIDCSELYLAVRNLYERDKEDEKKTKLYENSLKIAKFIVGE